MSVRVDIVRATLDHARELAPRMRRADVLEVAATSGRTPLQALEHALEVSDEVWAALFDGAVACLWGVVPLRRSVLRGRVGAAWLLTGDLVERHPRAFWRHCRRELAGLFARWDELVNAMDCRNTPALRWGERLGFRLEDPRAFGVEGLPFRRFSVRKEALRV